MIDENPAPPPGSAEIATAPRVSIGLPVYNGERFLAGAIASILAQTYTAFELIICDNASTDRTGEICRDFASKDPRVRYHRQPRNFGAIPRPVRRSRTTTRRPARASSDARSGG
jgi:cellulose synthase/poly-beta-1,6-N-acetylglucosamine synthase-like glycosyltransferase